MPPWAGISSVTVGRVLPALITTVDVAALLVESVSVSFAVKVPAVV